MWDKFQGCGNVYYGGRKMNVPWYEIMPFAAKKEDVPYIDGCQVTFDIPHNGKGRRKKKMKKVYGNKR